MVDAITLRFVYNTDLFSRTIQLAQYGFWASHVDARLEDGRWLGARLKGGVLIRPSDYSNPPYEQTVTIPYQFADLFYTFLHDQVGKPYDWAAVLAIAAERNWRLGNAWFCSELIAAGLEKCRYWKLITPGVAKVTVRDLFLMISSDTDVDVGPKRARVISRGGDA